MRELQKNEDISVYPYDKGSGLVIIDEEKGIEKVNDQIGNTTILNTDPTTRITRKIQSKLCELKKKGGFTKQEYEKLYPSDPVAPRMYGTVKAHKPEKDYPMRIVVSTIGTPTYEISKMLVDIIQPTLNRNKTLERL